MGGGGPLLSNSINTGVVSPHVDTRQVVREHNEALRPDKEALNEKKQTRLPVDDRYSQQLPGGPPVALMSYFTKMKMFG